MFSYFFSLDNCWTKSRVTCDVIDIFSFEISIYESYCINIYEFALFYSLQMHRCANFPTNEAKIRQFERPQVLHTVAEIEGTRAKTRVSIDGRIDSVRSVSIQTCFSFLPDDPLFWSETSFKLKLRMTSKYPNITSSDSALLLSDK